MPALSELSFPAMALNSLSVNELISTARAMTGDYIRSSILMISLHHPVLYQFIVNMDDAASIRIGLAMAIFRLVKKNVRLSREDR